MSYILKISSQVICRKEKLLSSFELFPHFCNHSNVNNCKWYVLINVFLFSSPAIPFTVAQSKVADLTRGNLLVGHALQHDFKVCTRILKIAYVATCSHVVQSIIAQIFASNI